ncbi:MAG: hypothetical protein ACKO9H_01210, partial [Planctomycetota bacterium]
MDGLHSLSAKVYDKAGNKATTTAAVTAMVATTAPSGSFSGTIGTEGGTSATISSGGLTKDNTLELSGSCGDANGVSHVEVWDGTTLLGVAS